MGHQQTANASTTITTIRVTRFLPRLEMKRNHTSYHMIMVAGMFFVGGFFVGYSPHGNFFASPECILCLGGYFFE
jgi:hypothetical protein